MLKNLKDIYWILGGIPKKGDKLNLSKKHCKNFKTFVFGNHYKEFKKNVKNKISINHLKYLKDILKEIFSDLEHKKLKKKSYFLVQQAHHLMALKILKIGENILIN